MKQVYYGETLTSGTSSVGYCEPLHVCLADLETEEFIIVFAGAESADDGGHDERRAPRRRRTFNKFLVGCGQTRANAIY
jgi:hypothetical protein